MYEDQQQGRTERLELVLQAALEARHTGIYVFERGKGGVRLTGKIVCFYGQPVEASIEDKVGIEALEWLSTWGSCQYTFTPLAPEAIALTPQTPLAPETPPQTPAISGPLNFFNQITENIPPLLQSLTRQNDNTTAKPVEDGSQAASPYQMPAPTYFPSTQSANQSQTQSPAQQSASYFSPAARQITENQAPLPHPSQQYLNPKTPLPPTREQITGPQSQQFGEKQITGPQSQQFGNRGVPSQPPFRLIQGSSAVMVLERAKVSRLHRHVYLLLDGQRTDTDLVRLTGHPLWEIRQILYELEQLGIIQQ